MIPRLLTDGEDFRLDRMNLGEAHCEVVSARPEFLLLRPLNPILGLLGGYAGLAALVDEEENAILDGGFPHYDRGGVLVSDRSGVKPGSPVKIGDILIGEIASNPSSNPRHGHNYALVEFSKGVDVSVSHYLMRGLSLSLSLCSPESALLRVIPHKPLGADAQALFRKKGVLSLGNAVL